MTRQLLYLLLALVLIVTVSLILPIDALRTEGFMPPRIAPFALAEARPTEPRYILVSDPSMKEAFESAPDSDQEGGELDHERNPSIEEAFNNVPNSNQVVAVSDTAYDAMSLKQRSDLLKDVQQMVREEIRGNRARPLSDMGSSDPSCSNSSCSSDPYSCSSCSSAPSSSSSSSSSSSCSSAPSSSSSSAPSTKQGEDYQRRSEKGECRHPRNPDGSCPSVPDMAQYIRKDNIPCWGCALDY